MDDSVQKENEALLFAALEIGCRILACGGEISRVEDTIERICSSYGADRIDVFAITTSVVVTMERKGCLTTQTRRVKDRQTDFNQLEALNHLSREFCRSHYPAEELQSRIQAVLAGSSGPAGSDKFSLQKRQALSVLAGYLLGAAAFTIFFGGTPMDAVTSAACAALLYGMDTWLTPIWKNHLLHLLVCSLTVGLMAIASARLGLCANADKVMIGDIMLLIPGISLTNALRDLFSGETITGILTMLEVLLQAVMIAFGFALAMIAGGMGQ